jgi:hypothetical protein
MDSYDDENTLDETFLINIIAGDKLTIRLRKDNDEVNTLRIENNSFLEFSALVKSPCKSPVASTN